MTRVFGIAHVVWNVRSYLRHIVNKNMKDSVSGVVRLGGSQASAFDVEITEKLLDLGAAYHLRNKCPDNRSLRKL